MYKMLPDFNFYVVYHMAIRQTPLLRPINPHYQVFNVNF